LRGEVKERRERGGGKERREERGKQACREGDERGELEC